MKITSGYCPGGKITDDILNTSESEKNIIHQHYNTFPTGRFNEISPRLYSCMRTETMLIKYVILVLSLIVLTLDVKNIRQRISQQDDIIAEV
jgi:hypothetical protein